MVCLCDTLPYSMSADEMPRQTEVVESLCVLAWQLKLALDELLKSNQVTMTVGATARTFRYQSLAKRR
jgi:hypothetical protein